MNTTLRVVMLSLVSVAVLAGCKSKPTVTPDQGTTTTVPPTGPSTTGTTTPGAFGPEDLDRDPNLRQRVIYFDFDQYTVKPEYQAVIAAHAKYLRDRPSARITLEGHTDERGSRTYNLGLGERRGNAVSSSLQANGGSGGQLAVVSFGEERPAATGSSEDAWARNRRVEITYTER